MREEKISIPLSEEGIEIYGILRGEFEGPLIILCHGYGGWMHETLLYNGARFFEKEGFSTLRLSMYGGGEKARNIGKSDLITHAASIDDVVEFANESGSTWIGLAGHSFSGMAIVYSEQQQFNAAALWDPTHSDGYDDLENKKHLDNDFIYLEEAKLYVSGLDSGYVYAESIFDNDYLKSREASQEFRISTCVINASWSEKQQKYGKDYSDNIDAETKHIVIPDSTHPFMEDGAAEKLFGETTKFFKNSLN